jgi:hypothetical protein
VSSAFVFHFLDPRLWTLDRLVLATKRLKIHKKSTGPLPVTRHALLTQKNFPINIKRLLDDDFLVKFFDYSASSRLRIFFARGSLISLWRGTASVTPFFGFSQRE